MAQLCAGDIADGFVWCSLAKYPSVPLVKVYQAYAKDLLRRGIDPSYDQFLTVFQCGEEARAATEEEKKCLLAAIGSPKFLRYHYIGQQLK